MSAAPPAEAKAETVEHWSAVAAKVTTEDDSKACEADLFRTGLAELKETVARLDDDRWLHEDRPQRPEALEA